MANGEGQPTYQLDVRGLSCPLPVLRAKKKLADMKSGEILEIVATDPGTTADFAAFTNQTGDTLLESTESPGGEYCFKICKV